MIRKGAVPKARPVLEIRDLTRADMAEVAKPRALNVVQRFRDPHHRVARFFALGLRTKEVAEKTGYSYGRVTGLFADPAFQELIASYRNTVDEAFKEEADDFITMATSNMIKAQRQIAEKLDKADEDGELLPVRELVAISADAADRVGYGKKQTNLNVNVDFAAQLERAIARSGKTIDVTPSAMGSVARPTSVPHSPKLEPILGPSQARRRVA